MKRLILLLLTLCGLLQAHDPIDVIIPCTEKDLPSLELCIDAIRTHGQDVRRIIVISKTKLTDKAEWFDEGRYPFTIRDMALAIASGDPKKAENLQRGWVFQQLLKLYAPFVIPDISSNVLCLDSDVVFFRPVQFVTSDGAALYATSSEYYPSYFEQMHRLLPSLHRVFPQFSGICHHMLFQRPILEELFAEIQAAHPGKEPWEAMCNTINPEHIGGPCLSEYEIYFNYIFSRGKNVRIRPLIWGNGGALSQEILNYHAQMGYNYVAYHAHSR